MNLRSAKYLPDGMIFCEMEHPEFGWIPHNASADDPETLQIYGRIINGEAGPIEPADTEVELLNQWRQEATCSNLQAKLALEDAGVLQAVEQIIAMANTRIRLAWDQAQYFRRLSPAVLSMQTALQWTDARMDELFEAAVLIEA